MKAIVTGGAGFIGSHLVDRLIEMDVEVIVLDNLVTGYMTNINPKAEFVHVDISDKNKLGVLGPVFKDCDVIFHLAASKKHSCLKDPSMDLNVNGNGTLLLLQLAKEYGVKKFVHTSTGSVYGSHDGIITEGTPLNPVSYYGVSKLAGERYVQVFNYIHGLDTTILRIFHVYGNRQPNDIETGGVVAIFGREIKEGGEMTIWGDGKQERVFTHVSDIVSANIVSWKSPKSGGQVYNCASEEHVTVAELAIRLMDYYGNKDIPIVYGPPLVGDIYNFNLNTRKVNELGVSFKPFSEGINYLG